MKEIKTQNDLLKCVIDWEKEYGEDFFDYFCHDNIKESSWAFYLLGLGYSEHANKIIDEILKDEYIDQELLFHVNSEEDCRSELDLNNAHNSNLRIMCEFLCATPYYFDIVKSFFKNS